MYIYIFLKYIVFNLLSKSEKLFLLLLKCPRARKKCENCWYNPPPSIKNKKTKQKQQQKNKKKTNKKTKTKSKKEEQK